ncbi:MAG: Cytochrome bd terminal oxidase subunit I, partial [uncultured Blastococcus sp.]
GRAGRGRPGHRTLAVRDHHRLPLPAGPADDRPGHPGRRHAHHVGAHRQARVAADDPVLGPRLPDQLRARRRDRPGAGVPVRPGLERVLAVRRRRLRLAAGPGGAAGVLPGVDVPGPVDLRLGPHPEEGAPGDVVGRGHRLDRQRVLHHRGELLDAAPGRRRHRRRDRPPAAGRLPRRADQQHRAGRLQPRDRRRAHGRRRPAGRRRALAPAPAEAGAAAGHRQRFRRVAPLGAPRRLGVLGRVRARRGHRRLAGQADVPAAAAEDELGRGAVRDRGAGVLLDLRLRQGRLERVRRRPLDHRPLHPQLPRARRLLHRRSRGQRAAGGVRRGLRRDLPRRPELRRQGGRADRLHPRPGGHLLELPADDRHGRGVGGRGGLRAVGHAQGPGAGLADRRPRLAAGGRRTVRRQRDRLDLHRDGPPAVRGAPEPRRPGRGPGVLLHRPGGLPRRQRRRGLDVADRADGGLRRAGDRGAVAAHPVRAPGRHHRGRRPGARLTARGHAGRRHRRPAPRARRRPLLRLL